MNTNYLFLFATFLFTQYICGIQENAFHLSYIYERSSRTTYYHWFSVAQLIVGLTAILWEACENSRLDLSGIKRQIHGYYLIATAFLSSCPPFFFSVVWIFFRSSPHLCIIFDWCMVLLIRKYPNVIIMYIGLVVCLSLYGWGSCMI